MTKEEKRLDRLNELLFALPVDNMPMTLSELDGYVTGVLACPEMIHRRNGSRRCGAKLATRNSRIKRRRKKRSAPLWSITIPWRER